MTDLRDGGVVPASREGRAGGEGGRCHPGALGRRDILAVSG